MSDPAIFGAELKLKICLWKCRLNRQIKLILHLKKGQSYNAHPHLTGQQLER